jgi:hypothetical protein
MNMIAALVTKGGPGSGPHPTGLTRAEAASDTAARDSKRAMSTGKIKDHQQAGLSHYNAAALHGAAGNEKAAKYHLSQGNLHYSAAWK